MAREEAETKISNTINPTERGSNRFPWKSFLVSVGLTVAGAALGYAISEVVFDDQVATLGLKGLTFGAGAGLGFTASSILIGRFNVFRENVIDLRGNGELHPKSPAFRQKAL